MGISAGAPPASGGSVIWKWNETDLSQFDIASPMLTPLGGTLTPSVVAGSFGNVIQLALASFRGQQFFAVKNLILPDRYTARIDLDKANNVGTASDNLALLVLSNNDPANLHGVQSHFGRSGLAGGYIIEAGTRITTGADTVSGTTTNTRTETDVQRAAGAVAGSPAFSMYFTQLGQSVDANGVSRSQDVTHAWAGSWNGLSLDKAALGVSTSNAKSDPQVWISALAFFKHPLDR